MTYEELVSPDDRVITFLRDERNRYKHIDIETHAVTSRVVTHSRR